MKGKMRWIFLTFGVLLVAANAPTVAAAAELTDAEVEVVADMMMERGGGVLVDAEILKDREGNEAFIAGYSRDEYIIVGRESFVFLEQADGRPPYSDAALEKYYGGFGCYVEDRGSGKVNVLSEEQVTEMPYMPAVEERIKTERIKEKSSAVDPASITVSSVKHLSAAYTKVRKIAFGNNAGEYENTCTAVAMTIALNYLDYTFDSRLVPSSFHLEERSLNGYSALRYQQATAFHHYLVDECGIAPVNFGDFSYGAWGDKAENGYVAYLLKDSERTEANVGFTWSLGDWGKCENSIDHDVPAIISTLFAEADGIDYSTHTMVVYGYRKLSDGTTEINVHTGWYNNKGIADCTWLPKDIAAVTYGFTLSDGWHYSEQGLWRYYRNGNYVTGWNDIDGHTYYFGISGARTTGTMVLGWKRYFFDDDGIYTGFEEVLSSPDTGVSVYDSFQGMRRAVD